MKLYSRRQEEKNGLVSDIFEYDKFPVKFRNQCFYIIEDFDDKTRLHTNIDIWKVVGDILLREKGWKELVHGYANYRKEETEKFFEKASNVDFLDYIELAFHTIYIILTKTNSFYSNVTTPSQNAINELNYRFKYNNLGYCFENGEIIRIDNEFIHSEIVKPSLQLVHDDRFIGAENEMMKSYEFRKRGDNKNAILEAEKAFESVMKTICRIMNYSYDSQTDTATKLIKILEDNKFFPNYLSSHINGIRITLESGLPTIRNKNAGHGQGDSVIQVPDAFVDYALNLLATNIVFLSKLVDQ